MPDAWVARAGARQRHFQILEVTTNELCPKLTVKHTTSFPLLQREDNVKFGIAADGSRVARYVAPYTGLFHLVLVADGDAKMRWRIAHGPPPHLAALGCS